jgi:hypothetical protein
MTANLRKRKKKPKKQSILMKDKIEIEINNKIKKEIKHNLKFNLLFMVNLIILLIKLFFFLKKKWHLKKRILNQNLLMFKRQNNLKVKYQKRQTLITISNLLENIIEIF